jgi:hypothetical protein
MICGLGRIGTLFGFPSGMALRRIRFARRRKWRQAAKNQRQRFRVRRKERSEWELRFETLSTSRLLLKHPGFTLVAVLA